MADFSPDECRAALEPLRAALRRSMQSLPPSAFIRDKPLPALITRLHLMTFSTGVVYSLSRACELQYHPSNRFPLDAKRDLAVYLRDISAILEEPILSRTDNLWLGGYYFNSALGRMCAIGEVFTKDVLAKTPKGKARLSGLKDDERRKELKRMLFETFPAIKPIWNERNNAYHESKGILRRKVFYREAIAGFSELVMVVTAEVDRFMASR